MDMSNMKLALPKDLIEHGLLSALQLETVRCSRLGDYVVLANAIGFHTCWRLEGSQRAMPNLSVSPF
jgi:hypothetical protein